MKKILLVFAAVMFAVSSSWAAVIIPKIGVDIPTSVNYDKGPNYDTKRGLNLSVEVRGDISKYFMWGAGFEYNLPRGLSNGAKFNLQTGTDFALSPLYVSIMCTPLGEWGKVKPYIKANLGYNIFASNDWGSGMKGGVYYGAGIGAEYRDFVGEFLVGNYKGEFDRPAVADSGVPGYGAQPAYDGLGMSYVKMGFYFGYKFKV